jgi:ABC-type multidrug transport system fused ATPase/permease subunit
VNILSKIISKPAKKTKLIKINFNDPWWSIFLKQRRSLVIALVYSLLDDSLKTVLPLVLGLVISSGSLNALFILIVAFVLLEVVGWFTFSPCITRIFTQTYDSFRYNAFKTLLAIDPIYHVQRPSGAIIGKIHRTNNAFLELSMVVINDLVPFAIELIALIISMFIFDFNLGVMVTFIVIILTSLFGFVAIKFTQKLEIDANKKDDTVHQKNVESLSQFQFIRSTFATDQIKHSLKDVHLDVMKSQTIVWMSYRIIKSLFVSIYFVALGFVAYYMLGLIDSGAITTLIALSLITTFLRGTKGIFKISKWMKELLKSYRLILDFYSFMRVFGRQTYPIFDEDEGSEPIEYNNQNINIRMTGFTFAYPGQPPLFKNNSLKLKVLEKYKNKMFGLIGPSGVGKTTILSILGGQLKPEEGTVLINDINIYKVSDNIRREVIAIQGQVATSLRGSLRYNILFGLPDSHGYTDQNLIEVLDSVGLWKIFAEKDGLKTFIGESGLNLSGGQRQRLNFANLYLRAKFFKPLLILIDEPTSSLDEISEKAITEMIEELAGVSVTFVIAHRLRTLQDAYEILDFSLIEPGSILKFYKPDELKQKSEYYRQLLEGIKQLEE